MKNRKNYEKQTSYISKDSLTLTLPWLWTPSSLFYCVWHNLYTFENYCAKIKSLKTSIFLFFRLPNQNNTQLQ
jgi:hypothetical protein